MNVLKCLILDDERSSINVLTRLISTRNDLYLATSTTNPLKAIQLVTDLGIELLFVDLHMELMHGVEVIEKVKDQVQVICVSAHNFYGPRLSELDVAFYLEKPLSRDKFNQAVDRVWLRSEESGDYKRGLSEKVLTLSDHVVVRLKGKASFMQVQLLDIELVYADGDSTKLLYTEGEVYIDYSLGEIERKLPASHFLRVHKGFVIPLRRIRYYTAKDGIKLRGSSYKHNVPVGRKYKMKLEEFINNQQRLH